MAMAAAESAESPSYNLSPEDLESLVYYVLEIPPSEFASKLPRM